MHLRSGKTKRYGTFKIYNALVIFGSGIYKSLAGGKIHIIILFSDVIQLTKIFPFKRS